MGRWLILFGLLLIVLGVAWPLLAKLGLGRLSGDLRIKRESFASQSPGCSGCFAANAWTRKGKRAILRDLFDAPVAQRIRVLASEAKGRGFESRRARQIP
jgi:hypothetical protein